MGMTTTRKQGAIRPARRFNITAAFRLALLAMLVAASAIIAPASASASFKLSSTFGDTPQPPNGDGMFFGSPQGVAVSEATGDVYVADGGERILRYDAEGHFLEAWGWGVGDGEEKFERCGPQGEVAFPACPGRGEGNGLGGQGEGRLSRPEAVNVDPSSGDVFVENGTSETRLVEVFTANGEYLASFGERGTAQPSQVQRVGGPLGFTIRGASGAVYLLDTGLAFGPRIVVYRMSVPGDVHTYAYAEEKFGPLDGGWAHNVVQMASNGNEDLFLGQEQTLLKFPEGTTSEPHCKVRKPFVSGMTADHDGKLLIYYTGLSNHFIVLTAECNGESWPVKTEFNGAAGQQFTFGMAYNDTYAAPGLGKGTLYVVTGAGPGGQPPKIVIFGSVAEEKPVSGEVYADSVSTETATIHGSVNPNGALTEYRVLYGHEGPCSSHECSETAIGTLSPENTAVNVSASLNGLLPDTVYYFRLVATNHFGTALSTEGNFRTFAREFASGDGRAWELVSPSDKRGGEVFPLDPLIGSCTSCAPGENNIEMLRQASDDGGSIAYEGFPFAETGGGVSENEYVASRTASGWETDNITPGLFVRGSRGYQALSPDLKLAVVGQPSPALTSDALPEPYPDLYLQHTVSGALEPLVTSRALHRTEGTDAFDLQLAGQTRDLSHLVFVANDALTGATEDAPAASDGGPLGRNLYEWEAGTLRLVNVLPGNKTTVTGAGLGAGRAYRPLEDATASTHAVSDDGERVFWSDEASGQVYVRISGSVTFEIPDGGRFLMASADGGRVLLNDGHIYDLASHALTDLSGGAGGFAGLVGASDDMSHVYFVDSAVLSNTPNGSGAKAQAGAENLYLYTLGSAPRYIATLSPGDAAFGVEEEEGTWHPEAVHRAAEISSDGRFLTFMSRAAITGLNNRPKSTTACEATTVCFEIFEYDAETESLTCASCNPTGTAPVGDSRLPLYPAVGGRFPPPQGLLSNGRLFFNSFDVLAGGDHSPGVENVYEYEPAGLGTCTTATGCRYLLSSGRGPYDASFVDASASGSDVFFATRAQLLPQDTDEAYDLYDAREAGGFPEVSSTGSCSGEGCKLPSPVTPLLGIPGSATFVGPTNNPPPALKASPKPHKAKRKVVCRKVKRRVRCTRHSPHKTKRNSKGKK